MTPFDNLDAEKAQQLVTAPTDFAEIEKFIAGDHWQTGTGFTGPMEAGNDATTRDVLNKAVHTNFTSENAIGEVVHRRVDAVLSKVPQFSFVTRRRITPGEGPAQQEQRRIDAANEAVREWFARQKVYDTLQQFGVSICAHQVSYLRLYVPPDRLREDGTLKARVDTPADALRHIFIEHVKPDAATVWTHRRSMYDVGIILTSEQDTEGNTETAIELCFLDPDDVGDSGQPVTVMRRETLHRITTTDREREGDADAQQVRLDLGGRLTVYRGEDRRRFVSQQMIEQQKALNTASTEMRIVNDDAGFPIRLIFNALAPGEFKQLEDGTLDFVPADNFHYRPGSIGFLQGVEVEDENRNIRDIKQPGVGTLQSGNPQNYINEMRARRRGILNEANQLFVEIMDDATATGESRIHALFDYLLNAQHFKRVVDGAGAHMLEAAWALAHHLAAQSTDDHDLAVDFNCKINIPFLPASLVDTLIKLMEAGVRSRETLMNDTGVDDVEAELDRVENTPKWRIAQEKALGEAMQAWTGAGAMFETVLQRVMGAVGMSRDDVLELLRQDADLVGVVGEDERFAGDGQTNRPDDEPNGLPNNPSGGTLPDVSINA